MASYGEYTGLGTNGFEVSLGYLTGVPDVGLFSGKNEVKLAFKGLLKRDATTREKSIVDLLAYVQSNTDEIGDDLLMISWAQMYPKLALDDSKKVRSHSHQIQGIFVGTLGRKYAKYLRDTVGIWLAGLYDVDRSTAKVCNVSLNDAFGNNPSKVNNLWKAFMPQILNYPLHVVTKESKDTLSDDRFVSKEDADNKWIRTNLAALLLMTKALTELNDTNEVTRSLVHHYFNAEQTLDFFSHSDFNLKKSIYQGLKTLVNCNYASEIVDNKLYKNLSKAAVKGLKVDKKKNVILYTNVVIPLLDTLVALTNYDNTFWANTKKAAERIDDILALGSLNSNPVYYDVVVKLLTILPEDFIQWENENVMHYTELVMNSLRQEKAGPFIERGWIVFVIWTLFALPKLDSADKFIDFIMIEVVKLLDSPRPLPPALIKALHQLPKVANDNRDVLLDINSFIMDGMPGKEIEIEDHDYQIKHLNSLLTNFVSLLAVTKSDLLEVLIANAVDSLDDENEEHSNPTLSFEVINIYIQKDVMQFCEVIDNFMAKLSEYLTPTFVDLPVTVIVTYSKSALCNSETLTKLVEDVYIKLKTFDQVDVLIKALPAIKNINLHRLPNLSTYLVNNTTRSQTPEATTSGNSDILYNFLTAEVLKNLYISDPLETFIENVYNHYNEEAVLEFAKADDTFLVKLLTKSDTANSSLLLTKIEAKLGQDAALLGKYKTAIMEFLDTSNSEAVKERILTFEEPVIQSLINQDFVERFSRCIPEGPFTKTVPANLLGTGIYLFGPLSDMTIDTQNISKLLDFPMLVSNLIKQRSDSVALETLFQLAYCSELASDLLFLSKSEDIINENEIIEFQVVIHNELSKQFSGVPLEDVVETFSGKLNSENRLQSYYAHRSLKRVLGEILERSGLSDFEMLNMNKFTSPRLLYVLVDSSKKFLTSAKLDRLRNLHAANLINLRTSKDIMTVGLESLVMLNAFMDLDLDYEVDSSFVMVAPQRFMMVLNSLTSWLDCDVCYDPEFEPVRQTLIQFVERYLKGVYYVCDSHYPSDFVATVFNLGMRLMSETLNLITAAYEGEASMSLLNACLDLLLLLNGYKDQIETFEETIGDVEDDLVDVLFKMSRKDLSMETQLFAMNSDLISKAIDSVVPLLKLQSFYGRLFELVESENVMIQRIGCTILTRLIPRVQDELVVEFTLAKKKANDDGVSDIHLPEPLLRLVHGEMLDHLEYESPHRVYGYLWGWYLLMDHFKNITHQMRQDYISELGEETISAFLLYVFEELGDMTKFQIHEDDLGYITNYSFQGDAILGYEDEIRKLLVNLVFDVSNYTGGTFCQTWFQSIRDRQMKTRVETTFRKWISPVLIGEILSTMSNKTEVEDNDFKIGINRKFNEVKCMFEIDEQMMEIAITLPDTYPLAPISVNGVSRVGVDEKKWKSWLMSAQYVINFQNGTVLDAIKHFKANVRANFENYEDCAICYSILNAVDHSTPNKKCTTCKNNFHSACLYRWFKSSGSSTCPLCRSKFQFKRHG